MSEKTIFDLRIYQFASVCFLLVPTAFFLFLWFSLSSSLMALRGNHAIASSLMIVVCFLVVNRVISLIFFRLKAKKQLIINDLIGISIFLLLLICGTIYTLSKPSNPDQESNAYTYFNSCLQKENFTDDHPLQFDSLLEPESWELFGTNKESSADRLTYVRLTYVDCLTEQIAKKYQRQFIKDYTGTKIQTTEAENYTLITAAGRDVMSLIIRKEKTVVILQIYGKYDDVSKTYNSLMQSVLSPVFSD